MAGKMGRDPDEDIGGEIEMTRLEKIINQAEVAMIRGKGMNMAQIQRYKNAVKQQEHNYLLEVMMLYMAEVLHDELGFGMKRIRKILTSVDSRMYEWVNEPDFTIDDLRVRVYKKTHYMFACSEEEHEYIVKLLEDAGVKVYVQTEQDGQTDEED